MTSPFVVLLVMMTNCVGHCRLLTLAELNLVMCWLFLLPIGDRSMTDWPRKDDLTTASDLSLVALKLAQL
jgi:hypothetical protein